MLATISLSYWVITREAATPGFGYIKYWQSSSLGIAGSSVASTDAAAGTTGAGLWTAVFAYYCLFIHILVTCFPIRSCWSIFDLTRSLKKMARSKALRDIKMSHHRRRGSSTSLSSSETLTSSRDGSAFSSSTSSEAGDFELDMYTDGDVTDTDNVIHAIVIPNYKEEVDILRETLEVLASHPQARYTYDVSFYLAAGSHSTACPSPTATTTMDHPRYSL